MKIALRFLVVMENKKQKLKKQKTPFQDIYIREKLVYNKHVFQKNIPSVGYETTLVNSNQRTGCVMYVVTDKYGKGGAK